MKKVFIILLMLVYGISSSGMTINLHYCCGELDDVSFSAKQTDDCPKGTHVKKSGCCNDKQLSAKIDADQEHAVKWVQTYKQLVTAPLYTTAHTIFTDHIISTDRLARGTPRPPSSVPLFVKNRVFRI